MLSAGTGGEEVSSIHQVTTSTGAGNYSPTSSNNIHHPVHGLVVVIVVVMEHRPPGSQAMPLKLKGDLSYESTESTLLVLVLLVVVSSGVT